MHPQQKNCDPNNPKKFAAWAFAAGVPDPRPAATTYIPLVLPQLAEGISQMLWDFGFRHHPELQTRWIEGAAGIGMVARIVDHKPRDFLQEAGEKFLEETNPKLLEAIKNADPEKREQLYQQLQKNFREIETLLKLIEEQRDDDAGCSTDR